MSLEFVMGVSVYLDPSMIYFVLPLLLVLDEVYYPQAIRDKLKVFVATRKFYLIYHSIAFLLGYITDDHKNHYNILTVTDHSENLGLFWYIFIEVRLLSNP